MCALRMQACNAKVATLVSSVTCRVCEGMRIHGLRGPYPAAALWALLLWLLVLLVLLQRSHGRSCAPAAAAAAAVIFLRSCITYPVPLCLARPGVHRRLENQGNALPACACPQLGPPLLASAQLLRALFCAPMMHAGLPWR